MQDQVSWWRAGTLALAASILGAILWGLPQNRTQDQEVKVEVELDAFSGRPNPRWNLTGAQAAEFRKRLHALKRSPTGPAAAEGLGYRGFVIRGNGGPVNGYDEGRLYRGTVALRTGASFETFTDPKRNLERWLLRSARGHVEEPVLQYISGELER